MTLITRKQLAEYLRLSPATVQTNAKRQRWDLIPPPIKMGNSLRWDKEKVDSWLEERQICFEAGSKAEPRPNRAMLGVQH